MKHSNKLSTLACTGTINELLTDMEVIFIWDRRKSDINLE